MDPVLLKTKYNSLRSKFEEVKTSTVYLHALVRYLQPSQMSTHRIINQRVNEDKVSSEVYVA